MKRGRPSILNRKVFLGVRLTVPQRLRLVHISNATGQPISEVARDIFALGLDTYEKQAVLRKSLQDDEGEPMTLEEYIAEYGDGKNA